jgi:hypothetical protein
MLRTNVFLIGCALIVLACGGDDSGASPAGGAGSGDSQAAGCPDFSGTWTIASHCGASLVGMQVTVTQSACKLTTGGSFPGFTGTVKTDGSFDLSGTSNGMSVSCTGMGTSHSLMESCTGNCNVTMTR